MNPIALIVSMFAATYSTRIAGFVFRGRSLPDSLERGLSVVPIAAFAALIAVSLDTGSAGADVRLAAAALAGVIAFIWKKFWLTLLAGMIAFWAIGAIA